LRRGFDGAGVCAVGKPIGLDWAEPWVQGGNDAVRDPFACARIARSDAVRRGRAIWGAGARNDRQGALASARRTL